MAVQGRVNINCVRHISLVMVLRVAVILLMAFGFLLYVSIFTSPPLLRKVLLAVVPCSEDGGRSKALNTAANAMLFTPKLPHAWDPAVRRKEMTEQYSRPQYMEFEDSISERSDPTYTRTAPRTFKGTAADSGNKQGDEEGQILKESNAMTDDGIIMHERRNGEKQSTRHLQSFTILVGVMTTASKMERRSLLRLAYGVQSSPDAHISVRFVIGGLEDVGSQKTLVGMENATYGDIIVLNCSENLNEGKTFAFFSSLPDMGLAYDYVMKTDDDSYIRFENLGRSLKLLPRTDLYYGYILPCENEDPYSWYMAGMGYLISWDLVVWIGESPIAKNKSVGTEDQLVGDWFNEGGVAKYRVNEKPRFYDHPEFGGKCAHELVPETILVHQVKTPERWANVLEFFEKDRISRALSLS